MPWLLEASIQCASSSPKPSVLGSAALIQGQFGRRRVSIGYYDQYNIKLLTVYLNCFNVYWQLFIGYVVFLISACHWKACQNDASNT